MKRIVLALLVLTALVAGCSSSKKAKPSPYVATEVEEEFRQRWIAKRMGEITAETGADARDARKQASQEFRQRFTHTTVAKKADPLAD